METFLFSLAVFAIALVLLSVRILILKSGEFRGTCSTQNQALHEEGIDCGVCVQKENDLCPTEDLSGLTAISQLSNPNRTNKLHNLY